LLAANGVAATTTTTTALTLPACDLGKPSPEGIAAF
jgi:hypothetical protein